MLLTGENSVRSTVMMFLSRVLFPDCRKPVNAIIVNDKSVFIGGLKGGKGLMDKPSDWYDMKQSNHTKTLPHVDSTEGDMSQEKNSVLRNSTPVPDGIGDVDRETGSSNKIRDE